MAHTDILAAFCTKFFDTYVPRMASYIVGDNNSIRVQLKDAPNQDLIFIYNSENDWTLTTVCAVSCRRLEVVHARV